MLSHGRKMLLANWKSHKTFKEAETWMKVIGPASKNSAYTIVLCPPFPFLAQLQWMIQTHGYAIELGTQNLSSFPAGAYTGEVTARNLEDMGITYALIGHSERRRYLHETTQEIANKVTQAIEGGITPIICMRREDIQSQVAALADQERKKVMVLYETVGHIGTGEVEPIDEVKKSIEMIRKAFDWDVPVLYGGSIDTSTKSLYMAESMIAGVVVGSGSLDASAFLKLV
jgi:triosephosphate isomerase